MKQAPIDIILVPQGAEHHAIQRGLRRSKAIEPLVIAIPMGPQPLERMLRSRLPAPPFSGESRNILLMGVCGSLTPDLQIGDVVMIGECLPQKARVGSEARRFDAELTEAICCQLGITNVVSALTTDRVLATAEDKQQAVKNGPAAVVEMEGFTALKLLSPSGHRIAMVRVVSDGCSHDIPDLSGAITDHGNLRPARLAWLLIRNPFASIRLIVGSIRALKILQRLTTDLFRDP